MLEYHKILPAMVSLSWLLHQIPKKSVLRHLLTYDLLEAISEMHNRYIYLPHTYDMYIICMWFLELHHFKKVQKYSI